MVRQPLYAPALAAGLPAAIAQAADGRFTALMGLAISLGSSRGSARLAQGMHLSVVCAEDFPRLAAHGEAPGRDFGGGFADFYRRLCPLWPRGEVPAEFYRIAPAVAATLVLSGGLDPVTPPRHGERAARALGERARQVVVAHAGHGVMALPCMRDVLYRFIDADDDAAALQVDAGCADRLPRPPAFVPPASEGAS
jgi:pimeloyl-ACP methyl ester carboxylesterase